MKKVLDVMKLFNLLVLIDLDFLQPYSLIIAAGGVQRNDFKSNKFHQMNDRTDELQIKSGGWKVLVFNRARGRYVKGKRGLKFTSWVLSWQCFWPLFHSKRSTWMQGALAVQSSFSDGCSDTLHKHDRNTCTSGIFFFPSSIGGQIKIFLSCLM